LCACAMLSRRCCTERRATAYLCGQLPVGTGAGCCLTDHHRMLCAAASHGALCKARPPGCCLVACARLRCMARAHGLCLLYTAGRARQPAAAEQGRRAWVSIRDTAQAWRRASRRRRWRAWWRSRALSHPRPAARAAPTRGAPRPPLLRSTTRRTTMTTTTRTTMTWRRTRRSSRRWPRSALRRRPWQSGARGAALSTPLVVRSRAARREGGRGGAQASAGGAAPLLHRRASSAGLGLPARCVVERAADLCHVGLLPGPQGGLLMPKSVLRLRSPIRGLCTVVAGNAPCPTEAAELDLQDSNGGRVGVREGAHTSRSHLC